MTSIATGLQSVELEDDARLTRAAREGSRRAAGQLFDRHAPLVRRILVRTIGPSVELEDHVQETFLAFFRQITTLRSDDAARAFLVSIAVRLARRELRRRRVRRILTLFAPAEIVELAGADDGDDLAAREAVRRLFAILDDLDATSRVAFTLRHLEEMELVEIAEALGESLSSVKRRLARVTPIVEARVARDPALASYRDGGSR